MESGASEFSPPIGTGTLASASWDVQRADKQLRQARAVVMPADVIALLESSRREGERGARRSAGQRVDLATARLDNACEKHDRTAKAAVNAGHFASLHRSRRERRFLYISELPRFHTPSNLFTS